MRLKISLVATAAALATIITPLIASPAAAETPGTLESVSANAYYGKVGIGWRIRPFRLDPINIVAIDRATDGYVVGIRLITYGELGKRVWKMRTVPTGQTTGQWSTYLDAGYVEYALFQVCKINASNGAIASCEESRIMHNPFDDSSV